MPWDIGRLGDAREIGSPYTALRKDAPIYIPKRYRPKADEVARITSVTWVR